MVLFTWEPPLLEVLLVEDGAGLRLPCTSVRADETMAAAADRLLATEARLAGCVLRPLGAFDRPGGGVILGYAGCVSFAALEAAAGHIEALRLLPPGDACTAAAPDERAVTGAIVGASLAALRSTLDNGALAFDLLGAPCTLAELQQLHETILDRPLPRGAFRRDILKRRFDGHRLVPTGTFRSGAHRPSALFRMEDAEE